MTSLLRSPPAPRLPLECLQLILQHLADKNDLHTLATLLRVNRYVCDATLPFLYNDPFKHFKPTSKQHFDSNRRLAQTLLRQAPPERISDLVRATIMEWPVEEDETSRKVQPIASMPQQQSLSDHDDKSKETYPPPAASYLSHIRHLNFDQLSAYCTRYNQSGFMNNTPAHIKKYMNDHSLEDDLRHKSIDCLFDPQSASIYVANGLQQLIKTDLQWALCNPNQVESLDIPLSHIKRYLDCVQDFKALSSIKFLIRHTMRALPSMLNSMSTEDRAQAERIHEKLAPNIQDMILFIEKHTSLHKGVLRLVDCPSISDALESSPMTEDLQSRLFRCHPPLLNPRFLDNRNWRQFITRFEDTNLEYVESIECPWNWRKQLGSFADTFLQHCRSLKKLHWVVDRNNVFQWAMDEKRQHDADLIKGLVPKPLVPLKDIDLSYETIDPGHENDDATVAFGDTLESLKVHGSYRNGNDVDQPSQLRYGQGWHLPRLSLLESHLYKGTLHIAPEALVGCRSLVNVDLRDDLMEYDHRQIQSWLPSEHPFLKKIVLVGTPALSFHPDTLHATPNLNFLSLKMKYAWGYHYIPPVDELKTEQDNSNNNVDGVHGQEDQPSIYPLRPTWTWDWHLPNLTKLDLDAEFAYKFQFRMLQKCPRLEHILLNMSTNGRTHGRVVTLDDLSSEDGYMKLPHLKFFHIIGAWHMDNEVLRVLFHVVAPNIQHLLERLCTGFDLNGWMEATSGLHQLEDSYCSLDATEQQLQHWGLKSVDEHEVKDGSYETEFNFTDGTLCYYRPALVVAATP